MPHRHHVGGLPVIRPFPVYFVIFAGFFGYSLLITVFTPMLLRKMGAVSLLPAAVTLPTCTLARGILLFLYPAGQSSALAVKVPLVAFGAIAILAALLLLVT